MPTTMNDDRVRAAIEVLLAEMGEDPTREGLSRTPDRVAQALKFLTSGSISLPPYWGTLYWGRCPDI